MDECDASLKAGDPYHCLAPVLSMPQSGVTFVLPRIIIYAAL